MEFLSEDDKELLRRDCGFTNVKVINTSRQLFSYVAKYVAKVEKKGAGSPAPQVPEERTSLRDSPVLDGVTYQQEEEETEGRTWGIWRSELLPWAELVEFAAAFGRYFFGVRRVARRLYRRLDSRHGPLGFSVYTQQAGNLLLYAAELCLDSGTALSYAPLESETHA